MAIVRRHSKAKSLPVILGMKPLKVHLPAVVVCFLLASCSYTGPVSVHQPSSREAVIRLVEFIGEPYSAAVLVEKQAAACWGYRTNDFRTGVTVRAAHERDDSLIQFYRVDRNAISHVVPEPFLTVRAIRFDGKTRVTLRESAYACLLLGAVCRRLGLSDQIDQWLRGSQEC